MAISGAVRRLAVFVSVSSGIASCVSRLDNLQSSLDDIDDDATTEVFSTSTGDVVTASSSEPFWDGGADESAASAPTTPPCTDGLLNSEGFCVPQVRCAPGTFVSEVNDEQVCSPCASGQFSVEYDADACLSWRSCEAGEYVVKAGTSTTDRECAACPEGETTTTANSGECTGATDCEAGTFKSGETCEPCSAGNHCSGKTEAPIPCASDAWDDDGDPATPCVVKTSCAVGQYITQEGSAIADRICYFCNNETFSRTMNATSCAAWAACDAGSYVSLQGTPTTDRECTECTAGTFTAAPNLASCETWTTCAAPSEYVATTPSPVQDRSCSDCPSGYMAGEDNETTCDVAIPANLVTNYDFETDTSGWLSWVGTLSTSTARAHTGLRSLLVTGSGTGPAATTLDSVVEAGATYNVSFWVNIGKVSAAPVNITRSLTCTGGGPTYLWLANNASITSGAWTQLVGTFSIPSTCSSPKVQVYAEGTGANVDLYVDSVSVTKAP